MTPTLSEALTHVDQRPGTRCTVAVLLDQLHDNPDLAADLAAECRGTQPLSTLARATTYLVQQGVLPHALTQNSIGRHRRRDCRCP